MILISQSRKSSRDLEVQDILMTLRPTDSCNMYKEINNIAEIKDCLTSGTTLRKLAFQDVDFTSVSDQAQECWFSDCMFLGGRGISHLRPRMDEKCLVLPTFKDLPYNTFRNSLYTPSALYEGYVTGSPESYSECFDSKVYEHYINTGKVSTGIRETLARFLHDHAMNDALNDFLDGYDERSIVGIMGGHGLERTDPMYRKVVFLSKRLTEDGYLMVSGGGPGAMEATHLGAWMADRSEDETDEALSILKESPSFNDAGWLDTAFKVIGRFPAGKHVSLGIPTWLYGHEPATPFATHIAKYFDNSTREDNIITIAKGGIVYSPGSAGTMQEIFQDAVQNHYLSFGYASPMIFLGKEFWTEEIPIYRLMKHLEDKGRYRNLLLSITDSIEDVIETVEKFRNELI